MVNNRIISGILYRLRDVRISEVYRAIDRYCRGRVLDVGGRDFYMRVRNRRLEISSWTTCDISTDYKLTMDDGIYSFVVGDGCSLEYDNETFDTVINMQVLEHVFEPIRMFTEIARVLKKGGHGVFLIPQTSTLHYAPNHYYNFTRFWVEKAARNVEMEVIELIPWEELVYNGFPISFRWFSRP
jgi:ubiquinone/menaquinone biosynthesis C-methylase UbiE